MLTKEGLPKENLDKAREIVENIPQLDLSGSGSLFISVYDAEITIARLLPDLTKNTNLVNWLGVI